MSQVSIHMGEQLNSSAENADWRKQVDDLQVYLGTEASTLMRSVPPTGRQAFQDLADRAPVIMSKLQELEKLQNGRLEDIRRCQDQWEKASSNRTGDLQILDKRLEQLQKEEHALEQSLILLAHRRLDAQNKLAADEKAAKEHEKHTHEEDLRLNQRAADLDTRQRDLQSLEADLIQSTEALKQDLQKATEAQEEERKREEANRKESAMVNNRMDLLYDYGAQKDRQVNEAISRYDDLSLECNSLKDAKNDSEARLADIQTQLGASTVANTRLVKSNEEWLSKVSALTAQTNELQAKLATAEASQRESTKETASLKSDVARLEGTIQSQNKSLGRLNSTMDQVNELNAGVTYLSAVILPQKEEEISKLKAELGNAKEHASAHQKDLEGKINTLDMDISSLNDKVREQNSQLSELTNEKTSLQAVADSSTSEAESSRTDLAIAQTSIKSLEEETHRLSQKHSDLQAAARNCRLEHSDIDMIRQQVSDLIGEQDLLTEKNTSLATIRDELENAAEETEAELERLRVRIKSCHCSDRRPSRKRNYDEMDSGEDEYLFADHSERSSRRLGKAPETVAGPSDAGPSGAGEPEDTDTNLATQGSRMQGSPGQAGPSTDGTRPPMNTTAPRSLGKTIAMITPSESVAFTFSVTDAKLLRFSSDILPNEILQTLHRRFRDWTSKQPSSWDKVQSPRLGRSCIESRLDKKSSKWINGSDYVCNWCEKSMRLCILIDSAERVLLLPRKAAEDEGRGPRDAKYWIK